MAGLEQPDFYELLSLSREATTSEVKMAYHRALLRFHPDKNTSPILEHPLRAGSIPISLIKEAYTTLSEPTLRKQYDTFAGQHHTIDGSRPAEVISLAEFVESTDIIDEDGLYQYPCRCGGLFTISDSDMEKGHHLIGCNNCSEVVWAGYRLQSTDDDGICIFNLKHWWRHREAQRGSAQFPHCALGAVHRPRHIER